MLEERGLRQISWGAIFAGVFVALLTHIVLLLLGAAIGLSSVDTSQGTVVLRSVRSLGIFWTMLSLIIGMGAGGFFAAYLSRSTKRQDGAMYGFVTSSVALVLLLWSIGNSIAMGVNATIVQTPSERMEIGPQEEGIEMSSSVVEQGSTALWSIFFAMLLGATGACLGGMLGSQAYQKRLSKVGGYAEELLPVPPQTPSPVVG